MTPKKAAAAYRTIGEAAEEVGVQPHILRFWETKFPQVRPVKHAGGRRMYRAGDIALLKGVRACLHDHGLTVKGVQRLFREGGAAAVAAAADRAPRRGLEAALGEIRAARAILAKSLEARLP